MRGLYAFSPLSSFSRCLAEKSQPFDVGYGTLATGTAQYKGVGAFFFNFDGAMSNDLTKITVDCVGGDGYMFPWTEYIRQLDPASAGNLAC